MIHLRTRTLDVHYGGIFRIPTAIERIKVLLCDPKAMQGKCRVGNARGALSKIFVENMVCDFRKHFKSQVMMERLGAHSSSYLSVSNSSHLAFVIDYLAILGANRILRTLILDRHLRSTHLFQRLGSIGIASFLHDFIALQGKCSAIAEVFESTGKLKENLLRIICFI